MQKILDTLVKHGKIAVIAYEFFLEKSKLFGARFGFAVKFQKGVFARIVDGVDDEILLQWR